ncbi:MAG: hypothetical protein V1809_14740 [Planctomycetota bacterium]
MAINDSWRKIFDDLEIEKHDFNKAPYPISAKQIKSSCQKFTETGEKEVRILCKQDSRESRPSIFKSNNLFLLPVKNGHYVIIRGEGYIDLPAITQDVLNYHSKLKFSPDTTRVGDSEMQHLDYAYAASLIRSFTGDESLILTIRGRKYTPKFDFMVGNNRLIVSGVQTEVDAGYEGENQVVLIEAKNFLATNVIIRQLFYPFRQWQSKTKKKVSTLFFEMDKNANVISIWQFEFSDPDDYNSITLAKSGKYKIMGN